VHQLFIHFEKDYDSFKRDVLYDILIFLKLAVKIKMYLNQTCSRSRRDNMCLTCFLLRTV